ncbi:collectrin isoform X2 [Mustela lutreola]|uniref:Collectrin isoform X2 n=3 Tax=Mustela TaxID=9665 RepID=A0A8U0TFC8_MUSPF|nr:collectrin isoform X2 [Mustela putorius furo]XP_059014743.1 collectrin isoform X2 [Mustela lutreola]
MLCLLFFLVTAVRAELCQPDAENAFKVRLSIRTALGDKAYAWDTNEEYLFKAMVAFSMRKVPNRETTEISHVLLCNVTQRVSFWFVVTDPSKNHTLPAVEIQSAIRMNRNRINNAFFLNDQTLEFLKIPSTLAPPTDPSMPIWIIIFSVIFCIVIVAVMLLILSGIRQRRRDDFAGVTARYTGNNDLGGIKRVNAVVCLEWCLAHGERSEEQRTIRSG